MNASEVICEGFKRDDVFNGEPAPTTLQDQALPGSELSDLVGQVEVSTTRLASHGEPRALVDRSRGELARFYRSGIPFNGGSEIGDVAKAAGYRSWYLDRFG